MSTCGFPPIDAYAFLSDTHTTALVGPDGAVDWFCVPAADGDAVLARLLDRDVGGCFTLTVDGCPTPARRYLPGTLVVENRWDGAGVAAVGVDCLAAGPGSPEQPVRSDRVLVRRVTVARGTARLRARVTPRSGHGARAVRWRWAGDAWHADGTPLRLVTDLPVTVDGGTLLIAADVPTGHSVALLLAYGDGTPGDHPAAGDADALIERTCRTAREWSARSDYAGFAADQVRHSALVLRGLSYDETGALLAAATSSLPETLGGVRNWDYRYTWHRDAALLLLALFRLGHAEEGRRYLRFLLDVCAAQEGVLAPLVGIRGGTAAEREVPHLSGYAGSAPVRVGNGAAEQVQFDTYGHVLDAALAYQQLTGELTAEQWRSLRRLVDTMARRWREPDHGVWEIRGPRRHYVNSKVMTWVCLDRGVRLAGLLGDRDAPVERWRAARDALHAEILDRGYDERVGSFVLAYDSTDLDASLLRISLVGFLPGDDPRMVGTIERVRGDLAVAPALIRRYAVDDGLPGEEGAFLLCCFELVSALVLAGRRHDARALFDDLLSCAGPLGLYAEQLAADGTALGNYPQAFTHLALIEAALNLDAAGDRDALHAWAERGPRSPGTDRNREDPGLCRPT
ncbi:glycoside hydrolase family 15 protein [Micromonospora endolithica]|uniref:Glycoside hydrolase family 15 protein n=1 Tax=Micromonospora endolithica TaxID=230091 RepID=A0A3A9YVK6_9ACTN|nr:glycoside hydrolase family 15 protein [Micromonospora endolithica]RKN39604.1 glycoside hydrolase family 15 protein [Micromonospora endolithica]TWJ22259.1 GH15 family glucan-1,4-alpha-glucosidase [Micromonospora endolithica]